MVWRRERDQRSGGEKTCRVRYVESTCLSIQCITMSLTAAAAAAARGEVRAECASLGL